MSVSTSKDAQPASNVRPIAAAKKATAAKLKPASETQTEVDLANRFVTVAAGDYRYAGGRWYAYNGQRWLHDALETVREVAKLSAQSVLHESAALIDPDLFKLGVKAASARGVEAVLSLARSHPAIATRADAFDANPMKITVLNGTIDLDTMQLNAHSRDDLITKLAPVAYDPEARSDLWEKYLDDALDGDELRAFVQRAAGYSITGDTSEEKAFLVISPTRCGKGTFSDAVCAALGDYARSADFKTFLTDRNETGGSARPDLVRLTGSRFVTTSEVSKDARFDEARLKALTGRDALVARGLFQDSTETRPTFKLWFNCNISPKISDDAAVWARLYKISFDKLASIPIEQRDPTMKTRLVGLEENRAAVLAWLVRGCAEWRRIGLAPPAVVLTSTRRLRDELDTAKRFLAAHVAFDPAQSTTTEQLIAGYKAWCADEAEEAGSDKALIATMKDRAKALGLVLENKRVKGRRAWQGVSLVLGDSAGGVNHE